MGWSRVESEFPVPETEKRLVNALEEAGMTVMARVDHAANAETVDMSLRPTRLVVFGNPTAGTPLMQCSRTTAIDLPQKALIWRMAMARSGSAITAPITCRGVIQSPAVTNSWQA